MPLQSTYSLLPFQLLLLLWLLLLLLLLLAMHAVLATGY
jgi:hypothetical protein